MRAYLDLCCLKRPFDDQSQPRIHLESEAVLALLGAVADKIELLRSPALELENDRNPVAQRAAKVRLWLEALPTTEISDASLAARIAELMALGFKNFDALHLASAEALGADVLCTCDDRFLVVAGRESSRLKVRVLNPIDLVREVLR
jgi:predicted nucleic acid-binding protein